MRTTVEIPDDLMQDVQEYLGFKSKREVLVHALKEVQRKKRVEMFRSLAGKIDIKIDLDESRRRPGSKKDPWSASTRRS